LDAAKVVATEAHDLRLRTAKADTKDLLATADIDICRVAAS